MVNMARDVFYEEVDKDKKAELTYYNQRWLVSQAQDCPTI